MRRKSTKLERNGTIMKIFTKKVKQEKPELTEEQKAELEAKKAKRKEIGEKVLVTIGGVVFFIIGGLLVLAAIGTDPDALKNAKAEADAYDPEDATEAAYIDGGEPSAEEPTEQAE